MDSPSSDRFIPMTAFAHKRPDSARGYEEFVTLTVIPERSFYYTELSVGSSQDRIKARLDMDEADTWVQSNISSCRFRRKRDVQLKHDIPEHKFEDSQSLVVKNNSGVSKAKQPEKGPSSNLGLREQKGQQCDCYGFSTSKSRTFRQFEGKLFSLGIYEGIWGYEVVRLSRTTVNMTFGVADLESKFNAGVLGIANPDNSRWRGNKKSYLNFPMALKNANKTKRLSYSVYLQGGPPAKGSILFGAVDHEKYYGKLQTVPMVNIKRRAYKSGINIVLNKIYLENYQHKVVLLNEPIGASLDLNTQFLQLPRIVFNNLVESLSGKRLPGDLVYHVDCEYVYRTGKIVYEFSGIEIKYPIRDLIRINKGKCLLAVAPNDKPDEFPSAILTSSVLQNVYFNVDLERKEVSMAPVKFSFNDFVEEIVTSVPRAVKAKGYSTTSIVSEISYTHKVGKFKIYGPRFVMY